ncbi:MAG: hypothetical protein Kow0056_15540 [Coriobacteriia bacterium]
MRLLRELFLAAAVGGMAAAFMLLAGMAGGVVAGEPWPIDMLRMFMTAAFVGMSGIVGAALTSMAHWERTLHSW